MVSATEAMIKDLGASATTVNLVRGPEKAPPGAPATAVPMVGTALPADRARLLNYWGMARG